MIHRVRFIYMYIITMNTLNSILFYKLLVWGDAKVGISSGKRNLEPCVEKKDWMERMEKDES